MSNLRKLQEVAYLYYKKNYTQNEIASRLGVSNMTISRMLEKAHQEGIIKVEIIIPFQTCQNLESELVKKYPIKNACVVMNDNTQNTLNLVSQMAAFYLSIELKEYNLIGIAAGRTISRVFDNIPNDNYGIDVIVQLLGGMDEIREINPINILQKASHKIGAKGIYFNAPTYVSSSEEKKALFPAIVNNKLKNAWENCDLGIVGVGGVGEDALHVKSGFISPEEMREIIALGGVGDILGYYINFQGDLLDIEVNRRNMTIPINCLNKIKVVVVAEGLSKIRAISGVLNSDLVHTIYTDRETAVALINL